MFAVSAFLEGQALHMIGDGEVWLQAQNLASVQPCLLVRSELRSSAGEAGPERGDITVAINGAPVWSASHSRKRI
jgi:hypothetical protein